MPPLPHYFSQQWFFYCRLSRSNPPPPTHTIPTHTIPPTHTPSPLFVDCVSNWSKNKKMSTEIEGMGMLRNPSSQIKIFMILHGKMDFCFVCLSELYGWACPLHTFKNDAKCLIKEDFLRERGYVVKNEIRKWSLLIDHFTLSPPIWNT